MKKSILIFAAAAFTLTACKKNQQADELVTHESPVPPVQSESQLQQEAQSKPLTTVALSESHYDFGKIKNDETVKHVYEITNTGKNPLIISAVKPGCGCTAPEYTKEPILPGQKGSVTLAFDPSGFSGPVQKEASIFTNVEKSPVTITFSADIQP